MIIFYFDLNSQVKIFIVTLLEKRSSKFPKRKGMDPLSWPSLASVKTNFSFHLSQFTLPVRIRRYVIILSCNTLIYYYNSSCKYTYVTQHIIFLNNFSWFTSHFNCNITVIPYILASSFYYVMKKFTSRFFFDIKLAKFFSKKKKSWLSLSQKREKKKKKKKKAKFSSYGSKKNIFL